MFINTLPESGPVCAVNEKIDARFSETMRTRSVSVNVCEGFIAVSREITLADGTTALYRGNLGSWIQCKPWSVMPLNRRRGESQSHSHVLWTCIYIIISKVVAYNSEERITGSGLLLRGEPVSTPEAGQRMLQLIVYFGM